MSKRALTQATLFLLVYEAGVVVPVEIIVLSARLALVSKITDPREQIHNVEAVEEKRQNAEDRWSTY